MTHVIHCYFIYRLLVAVRYCVHLHTEGKARGMQITTILQPPPITILQLVIGWMSRDYILVVNVSPVVNGEEEIDDLLWQASQDYEQSLQSSQQSQSPGSLRFASPLSSKELLSKVEESVPENTRSNTKWAVTTWQEWVAERSRVTRNDVTVSLTEATNQQLSYGSHSLLQRLGSVMKKSIPAGLCIIFVLLYKDL